MKSRQRIGSTGKSLAKETKEAKEKGGEWERWRFQIRFAIAENGYDLPTMDSEATG